MRKPLRPTGRPAANCEAGVPKWDREGVAREALPDSVIAACVRFYTELAARMGLNGLPPTFAEREAHHVEYENEHVARSPEGMQLMAYAFPGFRRGLPVALRWMAAQVLSAAMQSVDVSAAVGLPEPAQRGRFALKALARRGGRPKTDFFVPGRPSRTYRRGYELSDIGPHPHRMD